MVVKKCYLIQFVPPASLLNLNRKSHTITSRSEGMFGLEHESCTVQLHLLDFAGIGKSVEER